MKYRPERLVIEKEVGDSPLVRRILATSPDIPIDWVWGKWQLS
jgi:hypothetical protein